MNLSDYGFLLSQENENTKTLPFSGIGTEPKSMIVHPSISSPFSGIFDSNFMLLRIPHDLPGL